MKTTDGGKELIVGMHGPGEFFGYLTLLQHTPHGDSAIAVDESELLYIPKDDFTAMRRPLSNSRATTWPPWWAPLPSR